MKMAHNSADIYAYIRENYTNIDVLYNISVSYLNTLIGEKRKDYSKASKIISPIRERPTEKNEDLDLTGSPLKDLCPIDTFTIDVSLNNKLSSYPWTQEEECFTGIPPEVARSILVDITSQTNPTDKIAYIWVLCDPSQNNETILYELDACSKRNSRGIVLYKGISALADLHIENLIREHLSAISETKKVETSFQNCFHITGNTTLKLSWTSSSLKPAINNLKNSDIVLYQNVKLENSDSVAQDYWRQLYFLSIIKDSIISYKENEVDGKEAVYTCGSGIETGILRERILSVMTDVSGYYYDENESESHEIEAVILRAKNRDYVDVTHRLWDILKCCSSYKELKNAFTYVFQCAAKCNIVNVPTNKSRLAEIIREVSQHRLAIPCLVGSEPLELLLEIGIEKISKDYENIFTESRICTVNDLRISKRSSTIENSGEQKLPIRKSLSKALTPSPDTKDARKTLLHTNNNSEETMSDKEFLGFQNSRFSKKDIEYKLSRLAQIHLLLEHLLLMQINLNTENVFNQISGELLQKSPQPFDTVKDAPNNTLEISIVSEKILHSLESREPNARRIEMVSENKFIKIITTFYYNMENIFPPCVSDKNSITAIDAKEITKENIYHCWKYSKISTRHS